MLSIWPSLFASTCAVTGVAVLVGPYLRQAGVPLPESAAAALVAGSYAVTALFPTGRYTTGLTLLLGAALPLGWPLEVLRRRVLLAQSRGRLFQRLPRRRPGSHRNADYPAHQPPPEG